MKHPFVRRSLALLLACALPLTAASPALAADTNSEAKQEVIYANLNADGTPGALYVVNLFDLDEAGTLTDYGTYTDLTQMSSTGALTCDGDTVTADAPAGKFYYEGVLAEGELPWTFTLSYRLDGETVTPEELAGQSGALEISLTVAENPACDSVYFDNFALQISATLDTYQASNIQADGATAANVGTDKQLTYTVLPGKGADILIKADVTDFEMDAITINGLPLSLDVEVDDEDLMEQVTELLDAIALLDDGAGALQDGAEELSDGSETLSDGTSALESGAEQLESGLGDAADGGADLTDGAKALSDGADTLDEGIQSLNQGVAQLSAGLDALDAQSETLTDGSAQIRDALVQIQTALDGVSTSTEEVEALVSASAELRQGIDDLTTGVKTLRDSVSYDSYKAVMLQSGLDLDALEEGNTEAIKSIDSLLGQVDALEQTFLAMGIPTELLDPLKEQGVTLASQIRTLLEGSNANIQGIETYLNTVSGNLEQIAQGAEELQASYTQFDAAVGQLADTLGGLLYQTALLAQGVNTLVAEYAQLDDGLNAYTDGVADVVAGYSQIADGTETLAEGSGSLSGGADSLYQGTAALLSGLVALYDASGSLTDGAGALDDGAAELLAGVVALYDGAAELKDGSETLRTETDGMDSDLSDQIDALIASVTGPGEDIPSFVSEKNTNVQSVQFALQIPAISVPEEETVEETTSTTSFWEKLLALFGL